MAMFNCFARPACPDCKKRHTLEVVESNYSGCGVDMVGCNNCKHVFCVSYKIDTLTRDTAWETKPSDDIAKA